MTSTVDFRSLESLSVLALTWSETPTAPLLPETIRVLDISRSRKIRWSLQDLAALHLPNLESFKADDNPLMENAHLSAILAPSLGKRSLRFLSLTHCPKLNFDSLEWLAGHAESLEELAIGWNAGVTDEMSQDVAKFKKLRYLNLRRSNITGIGLMNVVNGSPGVLRGVDISGCEKIDPDAIQLATNSGVKISRWLYGNW